MSLELALTDEQQMVQDTLRRMCEQVSDSNAVRDLEDDPVGYRPEVWSMLTQLGLHGPIQQGEAGLGSIETALIYEEFGRALCSTPHLVTSVLSAGAIERAGTAEQREHWLPLIGAGKAVISCAWLEPQGRSDAAGVTMTATPSATGAGALLHGTKILVPHAANADALLTLARAPEGITVYLVDAHAPGVTSTQLMTLGSDSSYRVEFDGVEVPAGAQLGAAGAGWALFEEAMIDVLVAVAAYAVGGAAKAHELATAYAAERVQFDRPIGSFQGIAHPLADMATEIAGARVLVREAAWARATGRAAQPLAAMAKWFACDVFRRTTKVAHQVFGGVGFTRAIDIQLYYRRAKQLELLWWEPDQLLERIAAAELDADAPFVTVAGERT
jgi:alkylation response protein AidB-like acyl-CoA dehydrogenase